MINRLSGKIFITLILLIALDAFIQYELFLQYQSRALVESSFRLAKIKTEIEEKLIYNLLLAKGAANFVSIEPDNLDRQKFENYARKMISESRALRNIGLAKDYTVRFVYPLAGNEKILGLDYKAIPQQFVKVEEAAHSGNLVIDGPLQLIQGGTGIIGRAPVMVEDSQGNQRYWGLVSTVINVDQLLSSAIQTQNDLDIAIRNTKDQNVFWGDGRLFDPNISSTMTVVSFPGGQWDIVATSRNAVHSHLELPFAKEVHALFILFCLMLCSGYYKTYKSDRLVHQTRENLRQAQSLVHLGNWKVDMKTKEVWWSEECFRIFGLDPQGENPTMDQIIKMCHPDDVEIVTRKLKITEETGRPYALDHRIVLPNGSNRHVQARGEVHVNDSGRPVYLHGTVIDITDRKEAELALKASEEMNRAMAEASLDAFITLNRDDEILFWSPAAEKMFGWTREEALGQKLHQLIVPERYRERAYKGLERFSTTGQGPFVGHAQEVIAVRKDGGEFPADLSVAPFKLGDDYFAQGSIRDASARKKDEKWLRYLATTDELTGLKNRRYFFERAQEEFKRAKRYSEPLAVIIFDIDHFKAINDTYGHDAGDKVLKQLALTLSPLMREHDLFGRHGGEEFTILLPHTSERGAVLVAERVRALIEQNVLELNDGRQITYTISLGVAQLDNSSQTFDRLLNTADKALYKAKETGRNRVVVI